VGMASQTAIGLKVGWVGHWGVEGLDVDPSALLKIMQQDSGMKSKHNQRRGRMGSAVGLSTHLVLPFTRLVCIRNDHLMSDER